MVLAAAAGAGVTCCHARVAALGDGITQEQQVPVFLLLFLFSLLLLDSEERAGSVGEQPTGKRR